MLLSSSGESDVLAIERRPAHAPHRGKMQPLQGRSRPSEIPGNNHSNRRYSHSDISCNPKTPLRLELGRHRFHVGVRGKCIPNQTDWKRRCGASRRLWLCVRLSFHPLLTFVESVEDSPARSFSHKRKTVSREGMANMRFIFAYSNFIENS